MPRPIDHLVLPVTTLTLARSHLTSLGFTVAPDAAHPFGTGNCCVFFKDRSYLEPIAVLDRAIADTAAAEGSVFVRRLKRFTERHGEGFAMLALRSVDAEADQVEFEKSGFGAGPPFRFTRKATLPDASEQEIGVVLAYTEMPAAAEATLFACQHLADVLFQPAYLEHPNGTLGIGAVLAVAEDPSEFRALLAVVSGEDNVGVTDGDLQAAVDGQSILVLTPAAYRERLGLEPPDARRSLRLAAIELVVTDIDIAIGHAGPTAMRHAGRIVVPPAPGLVAALAFEATAHG